MKFLVWSNQKQMWWRPVRRGYTGLIEEAGRYSHAEAHAIVSDATLGGRLTHQRINPITDQTYDSVDEVLVLAPEDVMALSATAGVGEGETDG